MSDLFTQKIYYLQSEFFEKLELFNKEQLELLKQQNEILLKLLEK